MKAADTSTHKRPPQRFRSLRNKIFVPFFTLVLLLSLAATMGAFLLAEKSYINSSDQRLIAAQEVLFREFKNYESVLQTYAVIMQQFQELSKKYGDNSELGILQDRLYKTLEDSNISTAFYPVDIADILPQQSLIDLFEQVKRSGKARYRYINELGPTPVLLVAIPTFDKGSIEQFLVLQTALGESFLKSVSSTMQVEASLLSLEGKVMARSSKNVTKLDLTPAQISHLGTGKPLFLDHSSSKGNERHLFSIIPLGNSDMVLLSLESHLSGFTANQRWTIIQMVIVMLFLILLGSTYYFRKISNLTRSVKDLSLATDELSRGNVNYRIQEISSDELGEISMAFNEMAQKLEGSYKERSDNEIQTALALEEDRTKAMLERKDQEKAKINDELSTLQRETTALYQLNQAMTAAIDLNSLFDRILQVLNEILACDHIVLLSFVPGENILTIERTSGIENDILNDITFTFDQGITGEAARSQRVIYVKNLDNDQRNLSYHGQVATRGSLVSAPLIVKGRLIGVINLHKREVDSFSVSELKLIQAVANQTAIAIDNAQLIERSRELSTTDELTGLSNRRHFQDILKREVAQARRFSSNFSIIMCDIDNYMKIKKGIGEVPADALLRQVGQKLLQSTRGIDLVSRFGNDQFIILLPKTNKRGALSAAEKLRNTISDQDYSSLISIKETLEVTASFGVTEFPVDSKNIYELLNLADRSLYAAKNDGGNCSVSWEGPAPGPE